MCSCDPPLLPWNSPGPELTLSILVFLLLAASPPLTSALEPSPTLPICPRPSLRQVPPAPAHTASRCTSGPRPDLVPGGGTPRRPPGVKGPPDPCCGDVPALSRVTSRPTQCGVGPHRCALPRESSSSPVEITLVHPPGARASAPTYSTSGARGLKRRLRPSAHLSRPDASPGPEPPSREGGPAPELQGPLTGPRTSPSFTRTSGSPPPPGRCFPPKRFHNSRDQPYPGIPVDVSFTANIRLVSIQGPHVTHANTSIYLYHFQRRTFLLNFLLCITTFFSCIISTLTGPAYDTINQF